jgi:hypothetical protein
MKHLGRLFLAILLFSSVLLAQTDEGRILGTITDATGSVVVGARVTITHTATGVNRVLTTNSVGDYSAPALKPGNYVVSAEFAGFKLGLRYDVSYPIQDSRDLLANYVPVLVSSGQLELPPM